MQEDAAQFRNAMGHFATGVTIVAGRDEIGNPVGLTANAVTSVSLLPPLVLVCMDRNSSTLAALLQAGHFGISILRAGHDQLARRFSEEIPDERFRELALRHSESGAPLLRDALAWLDCRVERSVRAGDHTVLFGEVLDSGVDLSGQPLVFFRGDYRTVTP